jgi:uncharacterized protein (TIGR00255 family)
VGGSMLKSMTGFGRYELATLERKFIIEMKAVNHRYCDLNIRMPKKLGFFEAAIRNLLKNYVQRGKIDMFITYEDYQENKTALRYNKDLANEYANYFETIAQQLGLVNDVTVSKIARCPEVITLEEQTMDEEELWKQLEETVKGAAQKFVETRIVEGDNLKVDLINKLDGMLVLVTAVEKRAPEVILDYKNKLEARVSDLVSGGFVEEQRIAAEIVMFTDKASINEEIVRLTSHIMHMKKTLLEGENVGRKLDFIAQEMNREANTILSKANDLLISNNAIDLKTEIEKIREQIQNIE